MNQGMYGYGLPPNYATRVIPPAWNNIAQFTTAGTYTTFVVPAGRLGHFLWRNQKQ